MGTGGTLDGVKIRDAVDPSIFAVVESDGSLRVTPGPTSIYVVRPIKTSTVVGNGTKVTVTTAQTTIVAANSNRIGGFIQNLDTSATLYLRFGSAGGLLAAPSDASAWLGPGETMEFGQPGAVYTGAIVGIVSAGSVVVGVNEEQP